MKTLEDIFSTKEQRELLDKYEYACYRKFQAEEDIERIKQALFDTLPIKPGVWFKYGDYSGVIKSAVLYNDLETMDIRYNTKGLEDEYSKDIEWLTINILANLDKIQIITEDDK